MLSEILSFLAVLNPFALFVYLSPVMEELKHRDFLYVLFKASLISFVIYLIFGLTGTWFFEKVIRIHFEAFRIFGGIIVFSIAFIFIVKGHRGLIHVKENLDDLASEIALPFMVGAATISLSILIGSSSQAMQTGLTILIVMILNFIIIITLKWARDNIRRKKLKIAFDKNMQILMRLSGFFMGSIGINMIIRGINNLYF